MHDMNPKVHIQQVSKRFGAQTVLNQIDLAMQDGEFLTLLGPSGCGKTTLLRALAGFYTPDEGRIWVDGVDITQQPPHRRDIGMVFQSYAVFPHMTVAQNVAYGLKARKLPAADIAQRVQKALERVQLAQLGGDGRVGGQQGPAFFVDGAGLDVGGHGGRQAGFDRRQAFLRCAQALHQAGQGF